MKFEELEKGMILYYRKYGRDGQFFITNKDDRKVEFIQVNHDYNEINREVVYRNIWNLETRTYKDMKEENNTKLYKKIIIYLFENRFKWREPNVFR